MSVHGRTLRLIVGGALGLLAGALWFWDSGSAQREARAAAAAAADSVSRAVRLAAEAKDEANDAAFRQALEQRLTTLPQPFSRLLQSMHKREPQLGTDGARHKIDETTGVRIADGFYLYDLVRRINPRRTVEVGLAEGFSALYILAALQSNGGGGSGGTGIHVAMDPFELSDWHGLALQKVKEAGMTNRFRFLPAMSSAALPTLAAEGKPFDIIFIDGDHRFDATLVDFVLSDAICAPDGYILLHDRWMASVSKVVTYIERNRSDYARRPVPDGVNIVAFQKVGPDSRPWRHFVEF